MVSVIVKDKTPNSMTKDKKIAVPATIIECPPIKIYSIRFYKDNKVLTEITSQNIDKELKKKIKIPKKKGKEIESVKDFDDVRVVVYSIVKKTAIKKNPDLTELGLAGSIEDKIKFVKDHVGKEISIVDIYEKGQLVDVRGVTKGKGFQGPVKRFGINLRPHKSEKGVRKVGSVGPWHPSRITFRVPMSGQTGLFTRVVYNNKILDLGKAEKKFTNIKNYGNVNSDYLLLRGSIQGPAKRQLVISTPLRVTKNQNKKDYEFLEVSK